MSKIRNLPETTMLSPNDLVYAIDVSEGPNAGRKATIQTLKTAVIADSTEIPYNGTQSGLVSTNVKTAIDETYARVLDHGDRHAPDAADGLAIAAPVTANADGNNNIGSANSYSRSDHKHNIQTTAPITQTPDQTNAAGVFQSLARADHVHNIPTSAAVGLDASSTNTQGVANTFARSDHTHDISTDAPISTGSANSEGVSTSFARADHIHNTTITNTEVKTNTLFTTNSLTDVIITGFTSTPIAGTYLVLANLDAQFGDNNRTSTISIYSDGTQITNTERSNQHFDQTRVAQACTQAIVTVDGTQAINIRVRVDGGTLSITNRSLILVRMG